MMARLIEIARARGFATMLGWVLTENTGMLKMVGKLGFAIAADPDDSHNCLVTLAL